MTWLRDQCPQCGDPLVDSWFDTTFRMPDGSDRIRLEVPSALCATCRQLYLDPDLIDILDVAGGRCVFAIESDVMMRQRSADLPL
jgi:hypothetical protein